ncbi:hypothetical protein CYMTET_11434 [Cymbomonas tetramitiformis]|uniref:Reverse transcriptase Ty1/copia-type domain-containing protein n=1 Tax=Cymbomonas tetramitiformis TaxID=36881 RepID=A0AAE0GMG7_9CHLO|nr:hypothetical protein CYMTET_11434 [Cymbomonas tetramitiformis]
MLAMQNLLLPTSCMCKVVNSGMVSFCEKVDKLGKVVTTWDPSMVSPLKTNFMLTTLDADYHDPPPQLKDVSVIELGVFLPEDSDEILAVIKIDTVEGQYWTSLRSYLDTHSDRLPSPLPLIDSDRLNVHYPLFTRVMVDMGLDNMEEGLICARAVGASTVPYYVILLTNFTFIDLPAGKGYHQAAATPDAEFWMEAIHLELEALVRIKGALRMMEECDIPLGIKPLDMSLVLKVKLDKHNQLQKRKARICAKGNKQEYGVNYEDTFAPCTQLSSVRLVVVLALNLGLTVYHTDVETAFLNSALDEDLYARLPRGLQYEGFNHAKLLKAVYGLKQAGKEWFETSDAFVMSYDDRMQRSSVEPCLYFIMVDGLMVLILAYVDDYLVATNIRDWYTDFVTSFNSKYACKDLGILDLVMMGIGVRWGDGVAYLSQVGYIVQMIETYGLSEAKPAALPMSPGCVLSPSDGKDATIPYRALLGQLQWVAKCSRPGIMAAVSALSRFSACYGQEHFVAPKQVVRYLKGTLEYELRCVSLSTTEAEIIAMSEGAREIKYILNVLDNIVKVHRPVPVYCGNQSAIHLASDYVNNSRSKHIEVRNMYVREQVKAKDVEPLYTGSGLTLLLVPPFVPLRQRVRRFAPNNVTMYSVNEK